MVACGPPGLESGKNILHRNNGDGTFTDVSDKAGILKTYGAYGLGVAAADFDNDAKKGGDIGAGHRVTALFEIIPREAQSQTDVPLSMPLKYQTPPVVREAPKGELLTVSLRYKHPDGAHSSLLSLPVVVNGGKPSASTDDFGFASAVAAFGMLLRDSEHKGSATFESVLELAEATKGRDPGGYRAEFVKLILKARALSATSRR